MNPGKLSHKITIQTYTGTQDDELNQVKSWSDWRTVWAEPMPKNGREYYRLSAVNSEIEEAFRIRYLSDVNPHQRVIFKGNTFEVIEVINPAEKNTELILTCKAVV